MPPGEERLSEDHRGHGVLVLLRAGTHAVVGHRAEAVPLDEELERHGGPGGALEFGGKCSEGCFLPDFEPASISGRERLGEGDFENCVVRVHGFAGEGGFFHRVFCPSGIHALFGFSVMSHKDATRAKTG